MKTKWLYGLLVLAGVFYAFFLYDKYRNAPSVNFSNLELSYLNGNAFNFNDLKGQRLVVSFAASWCGNCREELALLTALKDSELKELNVVVISDEAPEKAGILASKYHPAFTYLRLNKPFSSIGINAIPTTYILNKNLEVKKEQVGYINWEDASTREHIKKLTE